MLSLCLSQLSIKLFLGNQQSINNIKPPEKSMNDGPQNGFISAPGNHYGNDGTQTDTRANVNRNHISIITRSAITGGQKHCSTNKKR